MRKVPIHPPGHPAPRGAYSPGVKVELPGGALLFVTGQLAVDAAGHAVAPGDVTAQTEFVFQLIGAVLAKAGMDFDDVVRAQTYLTDMGDFQKFSAVRDRYFGRARPASTLLEVKGLAKPECVVEIEVTAMK
jgi:2-iminobutanoate/2-iminopropanoate deaminase